MTNDDNEKDDIQFQRKQLYISTLKVVQEEYKEIEKEVKKLGKRLSSLRWAIKGLGQLTDIDTSNCLGQFGIGTVVTTDEDRENMIRGKKK